MNSSSQMVICYLGLGGNLGHPLELFDEVLKTFRQHPLTSAVRESPRFESAPVDATGPNYVNSVLEVQWSGTAQELLQVCQHLESRLGRVRTTRNAPRPIDVDVLLVGQQTVQDPNLIVPHPRMHLRRFVLEPLLQLNPDAHIPGVGLARDSLNGTLDQDVKPI